VNIAELVLNLGVKGTDKTTSALGGVQKSLKDTSSMALETKVALVGALYALERLFSASGQRGTDLENFNAVTGVSIQRLQQYQYAGRQVGATNEEIESSFKSLQAAMADVGMNQGAPSGMAHVADVLGIDISEDDIKEFAKKPEKLFQILQQYAQKETDIGLRNRTLKTFAGITDTIIAGMTKGVFNEQVFSRAPTYSNKEVKNLNDANIEWKNLQTKIEMQVGRFNAAHGKELVEGISHIADEVFRLADAFRVFAEKIGLFDTILPKVVQGWTAIISLMTSFVEKVTQKSIGEVLKDFALDTKQYITGSSEAQDAADKKLADTLRQRAAKGLPLPQGVDKSEAARVLLKYPDEKAKSPLATVGQAFTANIPPSPVAAKTPVSPVAPVAKVIPILSPTKVAAPAKLPQVQVNNSTGAEVNIEQNFNYQHDGRDSKQVAKDVKKAANEAYRQLPQGQVK